MIDPKDVTVIVPHLGGSYEMEYALDQCLQSLEETVPDIKKLVVINGTRCIQHRQGVADIVIKAQGQCRAVNAAVATINTPWIFVTNDDMIYAPGWFEKLVEYTEGSWGDIEIQCISPKLIEPIDGAPTFEKYFCGGTGGDFDKAKWLEFARNYQGIGCRTGFNLPFLIKRELFNLIEQYDINYDPFGSNGDSDLEYKIKLAGVQSYQNTNSIVYHFSQTSGTSHPDNRPYWEKNWHYFIEKWGFERASSPLIWTADFEILQDKLKYHPWWEGKYAN